MNSIFRLTMIMLSFFYLIYTSISKAIALDLTAAKDSVGAIFASKFCEAKKGLFLRFLKRVCTK